jgi:Zn-dependent protease with chaperone function
MEETMKLKETQNRFWQPLWLPLVALSAVMAAPQLTAPAHAGLFGLSEQDEIEAGREVAAQAQKEYGAALPYNDPMSVRVRTIGQQFARLSTRKNIPFTYQVLANDKVLNAFAAPGGPVFVTRKLVTTTSNDAELAYVLGHETGHIERKHIVKSVEKQQKVGLVAGVLGSLFSKGKSGNVIGTIGGLAFTVWEKGYSRDQESDADVTGVRWMSQLGYDPQAAITMLGKLDDGGNSGFLDKYLATHPDPKKRQATVSALIQKENLNDVSRRTGGPRLWMNGSSSWNNAAYNPNSYTSYSQNPASQYPDYAQPAYQGNTQSGRNGNLDFGVPLVYTDKGKSRILLGPVLEIARWAGASAQVTGDIIKIARGNNVLTLKENSTSVDLSGRRTSLSVATQRYNGTLYAPLGTIIQGLGGQSSYNQNTNRINIQLDNQSGFIQLQ